MKKRLKQKYCSHLYCTRPIPAEHEFCEKHWPRCDMIKCNRLVEKDGYCLIHMHLCLIPGCDQHCRTQGLCGTHYNHHLRKRKRHQNEAICYQPECLRSAEQDGFCYEHGESAILNQTCAVPGCITRAFQDGHCHNHFLHLHTTGMVMKPKLFCGYENCKNRHNAKGLCRKHYDQYRRSLKQRMREETENDPN